MNTFRGYQQPGDVIIPDRGKGKDQCLRNLVRTVSMGGAAQHELWLHTQTQTHEVLLNANTTFNCYLGIPINKCQSFYFLLFLMTNIYSFLNFLLEYGWFTMLCVFQVCSQVNQLYMYLYPHFLRFFSHIDHYRVWSGVPCAVQQIYFIYSSVYVSVLTSQFIPPPRPPGNYKLNVNGGGQQQA